MSRKHQSRRKLLGSFTLSFGQHLGKPLKAVPKSYLRWVLASEDKLPATDVWAVREFLTEKKTHRSQNVNRSEDSGSRKPFKQNRSE